VTIQPNLREWLTPLRKHTGKVAPDEFRKAFDQARIAAGIEVWPDNALRHSFASYHLAHHKNAAALALEMRLTDSGLIFAHYRELVKPKDAERGKASGLDRASGKNEASPRTDQQFQRSR
jgi:hypothetical protein